VFGDAAGVSDAGAEAKFAGVSGVGEDTTLFDLVALLQAVSKTGSNTDANKLVRGLLNASSL
jgi:hypothetical protein